MSTLKKMDRKQIEAEIQEHLKDMGISLNEIWIGGDADGVHYNIEGIKHEVMVDISDDSEVYLETFNKDSEEFGNGVQRKTLKGVKNYLDRYIE